MAADALTIGRSAFQGTCEPGVTTVKCVTACSDDVGDMDFTDTRISAVLLGSS